MKKMISCFLSVVFLLSLLPSTFAVGTESSGEADISTGKDLAGEYYDEIFGDGSPYQVISIQPAETGNSLAVAYCAERDTRLAVTVTDEDSGKQILRRELFAPRGEHSLTVEADLNSFPTFYRIEAALVGGGDTFTYYEHTHAWQDFMALTPYDNAFSGQTVITYGTDSTGLENFVVVRKDVKVIRVADLDDGRTSGGDAASLMGLMDDEGRNQYRCSGLDNESGQILSGLESGDKLLILPLGNEADAKALVVASVEADAVLMSGEGVSDVTITSGEDETRLEDFFDVVRIRAEVQVDTGDIDTFDADPDLEISGNEAEEAELLGSVSGGRSARQSFTLRKSAYGVTVTDTFSLSASVTFTVNYWFLTLQSVSVQASLHAHNYFNIYSNYSVSYSNSWYVGSIYLGNVAGINFTIPVYVTFYVNLGASFSYTANQDASLTMYAYYKGGCSCTTYRSVSADRKVTSKSYATARLGVKASIQASLTIIPLYAALTGEAGLEVQGSIRNGRFEGNLYGYAQPSFSIRWRNKQLAGRTWPMSKWRIASTSSRSIFASMQELASMNQTELQKQLDASGDGVEVPIASPDDLRLLAEYTNAGKITKNIRFVLDVEDGSMDMGGAIMAPIGTAAHPFCGEFDGGKTALLGLLVTGGENIGLFGYASGAEIHDVILKDTEIAGGVSGGGVSMMDASATESSAGGIVGTATDGTWIYDTAVSGMVSGASCVGGIVGILRGSSLLNSASNAEVFGTDAAGGIVGVFVAAPANADTSAVCQIVNCSALGTVEASGVSGGVCGSVKQESVPEGVTLPQTGCADSGIVYCYYLDGSAPRAVGNSSDTVAVKVWPVTAAQAAGTENAAMIDSAGTGYAHAVTLLEALNKWYAVYGAHKDGDNVEIPEETVADAYNKWYADDMGGYPVFADRQDVYPLRVSYVDEDGNELHPSVTRYLQWGEHFRVDGWMKDGYHVEIDNAIWKEENGQRYIEGYMTGDMQNSPKPETGEDGLIPGFTGLEFRFVYVPDSAYENRASALGASGASAKRGSIYEVRDASDLLGLSAYASAGGGTAGVIFEQTQDIDMSGQSWTPIADFQGMYRGNVLEIQNLSASLFAALDGAEAREVRLVSSKVNGGGALADTAKSSTLDSCVADAATVTNNGASGGLVGTAVNSAVRNCSASGSVQGTRVGGLVGEITGGVYVNCASTASVTGGELAGGLAASASGADIRNCYANGNVTDGALSGGLLGQLDGGAIANSFASGSVKGTVSGAVIGKVGGAVTGKNIFTVSGTASAPVGSGDNLEVQTFDANAAGYKAMLDNLNAWVSAAASGEYRVWIAAETKESGSEDDNTADMRLTAPPVFGDAYSGWMMNLKLEGGRVSFQYDPSGYSGVTAMVCAYNANGKLLAAETVNVGDTGFAVSADASSAAAFLLDGVYCPLGVVRTA